MVLHPSTVDANTGTVSADGRLDIDFTLVDIDYRRFLVQSEQIDLNYVIGFRYGQLQQTFGSRVTDLLVALNPDGQVGTDIDFYGAGVRLGLEAEQYARRTHMMFYAKGIASLMAGEFTGTYRQTVQNNSNWGVDTSWQAGRIVPTLDLEFGGGFYSKCGTWRLTAGYMFSFWANVVETQDFIQSVQTNNFAGMGSLMTFDGLVVRYEGRF